MEIRQTCLSNQYAKQIWMQSTRDSEIYTIKVTVCDIKTQIHDTKQGAQGFTKHHGILFINIMMLNGRMQVTLPSSRDCRKKNMFLNFSHIKLGT